jgi:hypothetical protein
MATSRTINSIIEEVKEVKLPMEGASNIPVGEKVSLFVTDSDIICLQNATSKRWRTTAQALAAYRIFENADNIKELETSDDMWGKDGHISLQESILTGKFSETSVLTCIGAVKRVDRSHPKIGFYYKPKAYKAYGEYEKLRTEALRAPREVSDTDRARGVKSSRDLWVEAYRTLRESGLTNDASEKDIEMMPLFVVNNK